MTSDPNDNPFARASVWPRMPATPLRVGPISKPATPAAVDAPPRKGDGQITPAFVRPSITAPPAATLPPPPEPEPEPPPPEFIPATPEFIPPPPSAPPAERIADLPELDRPPPPIRGHLDDIKRVVFGPVGTLLAAFAIVAAALLLNRLEGGAPDAAPIPMVESPSPGVADAGPPTAQAGLETPPPLLSSPAAAAPAQGRTSVPPIRYESPPGVSPRPSTPPALVAEPRSGAAAAMDETLQAPAIIPAPRVTRDPQS